MNSSTDKPSIDTLFNGGCRLNFDHYELSSCPEFVAEYDCLDQQFRLQLFAKWKHENHDKILASVLNDVLDPSATKH